MEALEQNGRGDDGRAGEKDIIGRRNEGSVEDVERFLKDWSVACSRLILQKLTFR